MSSRPALGSDVDLVENLNTASTLASKNLPLRPGTTDPFAQAEIVQKPERTRTRRKTANTGVAANLEFTTAQLLEPLLHCIEQAALAVNTAGAIVCANHAACELFGLATLSGRQIDGLISLGEHAHFSLEVVTGGNSTTINKTLDARAHHAEGSSQRVRVRMHSAPAQAGRIVLCVLSTVADIASDSKKASVAAALKSTGTASQTSEALRRSEERFTALAGIAPVGIFRADTSGEILYLNPFAVRLLGYTDLPSARLAWTDLVDRADHDAFRAAWAEAALDGRPFALEFRLPSSQNDIRWVYGNIAFERRADGTLAGLVGALADISERHRAEASLQRLTARLNAVFMLSPDGVVFVDHNRDIAVSNPAFVNLTGIDLGSGQFGNERQLDEALHANAADQATWPPLAEAREDRIDTIEIKTPKRRTLRRSIRELRDVQGRIAGRALYFRDATHETEIDRMKSEFLSTAAHELRTPLASILGFSELLMSHKFSEERQRELTGRIHKQAGQLSELVNELLDLARIEARAGRDFHYSPMILGDLVRSCADGMMLRDDPRRPVIATGGKVKVLVDSGKFSQALVNILANAYKYSPNGGEISVSFPERIRAGKAEIGVAVRDHGIGMTEEQVKRVFERFFRAHPSGAIPGTGLGMSLVKEIMEIHHGKVELSSAPGMGSVVTLWLPRI